MPTKVTATRAIRWPLNPWQSALFCLLIVGTGVLYFWNLAANDWANSFYSAAVQAGTKSWEAFFYGSLDSSNAITVDKTPMSLWFMELSARIFGLSSVSILAPEVLMGVAGVVLLFFLIRKRFGFWAGMTAGLTLALTPVAALMFRFNNPDALLALLMILAVAATLRLNDTGNKRWAWLIGMFIGFAFLTKMFQAFLILPALAIPYLIFGRPKLGKRFIHLLLALIGLIIAAGWWITIVELVPASMRPYIGGSQNNSILELTFGYNGFGRLDGDETGSVVAGGGQGSAGQWGTPGILRMFDSDIGGQIAWLLPLVLITFIGAVILFWRTRKTDGRFFSAAVRGLSLLATMLTFSFMQGIFHQYYTVALAPYIAALAGIFIGTVIHYRHNLLVRMFAAATIFGSGIWAYILLGRNTELGWLKWSVTSLALIAAVLMVFSTSRHKLITVTTVVLATVALLAGPTYYTVYTVSHSHSGSIVTAGPSTGGSGFGGRAGNASRTGFGMGMPTPGRGAPTGTVPQGGFGHRGNPTGETTSRGTFGGGAGGLLNSATPSAAVQNLLTANASKYKWVAAAIGANNAAGYQLATELPVMSIGGFNGTDPYPNLSEFKKLVTAGQIHYYIATGGTGGRSSDAAITSWVEANFKAVSTGGTTLYDLTAAK